MIAEPTEQPTRIAFSPGVIDGRMGENVERAIAAFEAADRQEGGNDRRQSRELGQQRDPVRQWKRISHLADACTALAPDELACVKGDDEHQQEVEAPIHGLRHQMSDGVDTGAIDFIRMSCKRGQVRHGERHHHERHQ